MTSPSVSACLIIKNEALLLKDCLESIKHIVDEIIIVDTGSSDESVKIAKQYTSLLFTYPWQDDFSLARNFSLSKASKDWVLIIDADERLVPQSIPAFRALLHSHSPSTPQVFNFLAIAAEQQPMFTRALFPRLDGFYFYGKVHESLRYKGKVPIQWHCEDICYEHIVSQEASSRKLQYYLQLIEQELQQDLSPEDRVNYLRHLAHAQEKLHHKDAALNALQQAHTLFTQTTYVQKDIFYLNLLRDLVNLSIVSHPEQALNYAKEMAVFHPQFAEVWFCYAQCCFRKTSYRAALAIIEDLLCSTKPLASVLHISILLLEARCWIGLENYSRAKDLLEVLYLKVSTPEIDLFRQLVYLLSDINTSFDPSDYSYPLWVTDHEKKLLEKFIFTTL